MLLSARRLIVYTVMVSGISAVPHLIQPALFGPAVHALQSFCKIVDRLVTTYIYPPTSQCMQRQAYLEGL